VAEVIVDTNILLDLYTQDAVWEERSATAIASAADADVLVINPSSTLNSPSALRRSRS